VFFANTPLQKAHTRDELHTTFDGSFGVPTIGARPTMPYEHDLLADSDDEDDELPAPDKGKGKASTSTSSLKVHLFLSPDPLLALTSLSEVRA
jgi:hypothetical protein